jgi:two-component system, NtrC family, sensor histidine kinase HydH
LDTQALSALVATIVGLAIGGSVILREPRRTANAFFATFAFNIAIYYLFSFLSRGLESEFFDWAAMLAAVSLPATAQRFFQAFLGEEAGPPPLSRTTVAGAVVFYFAFCFSRFLDPIHLQGWFRWSFGAYVFTGLYLSVYYLYRRLRTSPSRVEHLRLRYLLIGGVAAVSTSMLEVWLGGITVGTILVIIYLFFLSQTLVRYRLLDLNELLGRMVVLGTLVVIITVIYAVLVLWAAPQQQGLFIFNALVASTAILILFEPLRTRVETAVNKWMFKEQYELSWRLENLRQDLLNIIDVRDIVPRVLSALEDSRRVTHAAIYVVDPDGSGYELMGNIGPRPEGRIDAIAHRTFFDRLRKESMLTLEGVERELSLQRAQKKNESDEKPLRSLMLRTLEMMNGSVALGIQGEEQLLGVLVLNDERLREAYSSNELELFRAVATSIGVTLQNSQVYERMKERDRLAILGQMAAGLAHEIRNPLGSIKGAAQFLLPTGASGDPASREFLDIIVEEVNRLNKIVSQFLDYARPYKGDQKLLDVNDLIRKTLALLQKEEAANGIEISTNLPELPAVRADAEQLRQVFLNLSINAMQAMNGDGKLHVSTGLRRAARLGAVAAFLEIRFRDTGPGIPDGDLKNLFIPFFTTKDKGTGLGLPISQRIAENHGGAIEVRSRLGAGSTFSVILPVEADVFATYNEGRRRPPPIPDEEPAPSLPPPVPSNQPS